MNDLENRCYNYLINLATELAADYETQFQSMEEFVRWNLPEEIALEWLDAEGMIQILKNADLPPKDELEILELIIYNFNRAFDESLCHVWTHAAMQSDDFWQQQRKLAQQILTIHNST